MSELKQHILGTLNMLALWIICAIALPVCLLCDAGVLGFGSLGKLTLAGLTAVAKFAGVSIDGEETEGEWHE